MLTLAPGVGVPVDWPYQLPVVLASLISTAGLVAVSMKLALPGGGGAWTNTSCCCTTALVVGSLLRA
ncbi:hypothetical protein D3C78_1952850 [compost metagenome]